MSKRKGKKVNLKKAILSRQDGKCKGFREECRYTTKILSEGCIEIDHIIEQSLSKCNSVDNLQALCANCHSRKTKAFKESPIKKLLSPVSKNVIYQNNKREIYARVKPSKLRDVKVWSKNRPPDEKRVEEISSTILDGTYVEGVMYLAEIGDYGEIVCYDGCHRRAAFLKLLESQEFKNTTVLCNILLRVDSQSEIEQRFKIINQSCPVPELYIPCTRTAELEKKKHLLKKEILSVVAKLRRVYPKVFSASSRPQRPNINRDALISKLTEYCLDNNLNHTAESLYEALVKCNEGYSEGKHILLEKYPKRAVAKAKTTGCFLFLKDFTEDL